MAKRNPLDSYWPLEAGTIAEATSSDSPYRIFKIQDAHIGIDVQQGMVGVLRYLHREYGITLICLEGSAGCLLIEEIKAVLEPDEREHLHRLWQEKGLSAPEYLALTSDLPLTLYGVEEGDLYVQNVEALHQTHECHNMAKPLFDTLMSHAKALQTKCGAKLQAFERAVANYQAHELPLNTFVLNCLCPENEPMIPIDEFPNLKRLVNCLGREAATDFKRVRPETGRLINNILTILESPRIDPGLFEQVVRAQRKLDGQLSGKLMDAKGEGQVAQYRRFVQGLSERLIRAAQGIKLGQLPPSNIYDMLIDLTTLCRLDVRHYPNLLHYTHQLHQSAAINRNKLWTELSDAIRFVREKLCENQIEQAVLKAVRAITGTRLICRIEATPEEVERLRSEFGHLSVKDLLKLLLVEPELAPEIEQLCKAAEAVEHALTKNNDKVAVLKAFSEYLQDSDRASADLARQVLAADLALEGGYSFYHLAPLRANVIAENMQRAMSAHNVTEAALVTGGFLTRQILAEFDDMSMSYVVITPPTATSTASYSDYVKSFGAERPHSAFLDELRKRAIAHKRSQADHTAEAANDC